MYTPTAEQIQQIQNSFTYHAPTGDQPERYTRLRNAAGELANLFVTNCPPSRELSLALTNLEMAVFCANAAIARHEKKA